VVRTRGCLEGVADVAFGVEKMTLGWSSAARTIVPLRRQPGHRVVQSAAVALGALWKIVQSSIEISSQFVWCLISSEELRGRL
jgi:hypothetical protein